MIKELAGEVVNAKALRDGSLLVFCNEMAQREKALSEANREVSVRCCRAAGVIKQGSSGLKG